MRVLYIESVNTTNWTSALSCDIVHCTHTISLWFLNMFKVDKCLRTYFVKA